VTYSLAHDSWEDAVDVHVPEKLEEYYQWKQTAIQALEYKEGRHCPEKSPSTPIPLPSLNNTGLPLRICYDFGYGTDTKYLPHLVACILSRKVELPKIPRLQIR
jgi:hypothetical protein